ncbi:cytochrome B6 [Clostridiales bacterium PH28_bin88]|nr:cytochrome B6 [Clostridiales bacterium PH28_bin88]
MRKVFRRLIRSQVGRSIFRHGFPDNPKDQSLVMTSHFLSHIHPVKVKKHGLSFTYTFGLGGLSLTCFLVLVFTGVLLMLYYVPSTERAYEDMLNLRNNASFGWFFRNLHRWAAHAMVALVFLHMCRVFYTGSYKGPRKFNWVIGVFLLLVTIFLSYTGYLLPWDQLAYWGVNVGVNLAGYVPVVGDDVQYLLLGAKRIGQDALTRFYLLHVVVLPAVLVLLMALHFYRIRKDGGISGPN